MAGVAVRSGLGVDVVVSSGSGLFVGTCDVAGMRRRIVVNVASTVSVVMVLVFLVSSVSVVAAPGRCRLRSGQFPQGRFRKRSCQRSRDLRRSRMNAVTAPSNTSAYPTMTAMPSASGTSWVSTTRSQTAWAMWAVTVVATVAVSSGWDRAKSFDSAAKAFTRVSREFLMSIVSRGLRCPVSGRSLLPVLCRWANDNGSHSPATSRVSIERWQLGLSRVRPRAGSPDRPGLPMGL